jgi:hypothetical protein
MLPIRLTNKRRMKKEEPEGSVIRTVREELTNRVMLNLKVKKKKKKKKRQE